MDTAHVYHLAHHVAIGGIDHGDVEFVMDLEWIIAKIFRRGLSKHDCVARWYEEEIRNKVQARYGHLDPVVSKKGVMHEIVPSVLIGIVITYIIYLGE